MPDLVLDGNVVTAAVVVDGMRRLVGAPSTPITARRCPTR